MPRSLKVRQPGAADIRRLQVELEEFPQPRQRRRAEAILLHAAGLEATAIAQALAAHPNTIRADLHAFDRDGLRALQATGSQPTPRLFTPAQLAEVCLLAETAPCELGLPWGRWSLSKLRDYLLKQRFCRHLSREHLRRLLRKGGCTLPAFSARSSVRTRSGARS
jgi:transposase